MFDKMFYFDMDETRQQKEFTTLGPDFQFELSLRAFWHSVPTVFVIL